MDLVSKVVVVAAVLGILWLVFQPRYVFLVRIQQGVPRLARGKLTGAFLYEVGLACAEFRVVRGWIGGVARGRRTALAFSRGFPAPCQQRLRNLWAVHGFS